MTSEREKKRILDEASMLLALGRAYVRKKAPYIATTLYGFIPQPVWNNPKVTLGVTPGLVLYFNPIWVVSDPELNGNKKEEVTGACLYHECWHPLHGMKRIEELTKKGMAAGLSERQAQEVANISDDLSINYAMREAGWNLPSWVCYPEKYGIRSGLLMEEYWTELMQLIQSGGLCLQGPPQEGSEQNGEPASGPCSGQCGGAAGHSGANELEEELDKEIGRHPADRARIQRTTAEEMKNHERQHGRGSVPGYYEDHFQFLKEKPLVRWESQLRHVLTKCAGIILPGDEEYSMMRPDKNSVLLGICLPSTIDIEPSIAFIRDTSGSMGEEDINAANNEIIHAMSALGVDRVWLLDADTETKGKPRYVSVQDIPKLAVRGRGGTSFVQPLEAVKKLAPRPDLVIYMTDGDGWAPDKKPREFDVIWCIVPGSMERRPATWGHVIYCSNNRERRQRYAGTV